MKQDETWHAWYASGLDWIHVGGRLEELYVIKHATSVDGIHWDRENEPVLASEHEHEATHRPTVIRVGDTHYMWFCHRGIEDFRDGANAYRIGRARSADLRTWERDERRSDLDPSDTGWDSGMNAYPYVVRSRDRVYLFYNGNGFGASGFGYAELGT
ncbi:MAG TPA: hypothetical protein VG408_08730 [Actinomycetota bacterium]|nr:hypothetical protein [Actinomycetota bacterium]